MSTIKCTTLQNLSGVEVYTAKAWVNFNGIGTVAIRASGNVSSITDNGVGDYTVNFTTAMPDANYGATVTASGMSGCVGISRDATTPRTTSAIRVGSTYQDGTAAAADPLVMTVAIFR